MTALPRLAGALLVLLLAVAGCSSSTSGKGSSPSIAGQYHLVGDVGGTQVKTGATVTLTLRPDGTLSMVAVQPGQRFTDTGTWQVTGDSITIEFKNQGIKGTGAYEFDGTTLTLPVLIFGEGEGQSAWTAVGAQVPSSSPTGPPPLADQFDAWDLDTDAAAAGTKAYSDAIAGGATDKDAVSQALTKVQTMPDVADATVSSNGLNIDIAYTDGIHETIATERLLPPAGANWSGGLGSDPASCEVLPGASPDPSEPGREGVNPGGGYGVQLYDQNQQPDPVSSADTPPDKRALLISPQYDVPHPIHGKPETIRGAAGSNIECLQASLTKVGYTVDTILGSVDAAGKRTNVGDAAIQQMIDKLTTTKYGVIYFLGHGYREGAADEFAGIWMGAFDLERPEVKAILAGKKIDRVLAQQINEAMTKAFGFTWDPAKPVFNLAPDGDGTPSIIVKPEFFRQLRSKGADFSKSLIMFDACSSALTKTMVTAAAPKVYLGWAQEMSGAFIADASEAIFDMLTDHARTVRAASQLWKIHERWKAKDPYEASEDWQKLVVLGQNGNEYSDIDAQTYILIFYIRHGPSSATSDITRNAKFVQNCYTNAWKPRLSALANPPCHALQYGSAYPTEGEVVDALFEVGVKPVGGGAGRWTLAD